MRFLATAVSLAALLGSFAPSVRELLVFDRNAIWKGEWWRLLTCQLVHFSPSHLICNLTVLGVFGAIIHRQRYPGFNLMCGVASLGIAFAVLLFQPQVRYFGGLSGLATAAVVFAAFHGRAETGPWRWICLLLLTATVAKVVFEWVMQASLFATFPDATLVPSPLSHLIGALVATVVFAWNSRLCSISSKHAREKSCEIAGARVGSAPCH